MTRGPVALALVLLLGSMVLADVTATIAPGDRVHADLEEGETDRFEFYVPGPASLSTNVKAEKGLFVRLGLLGPGGADVELGDALEPPFGRKPRIRNAPLLVGGVYTLLVERVEGAGEYDLKLKLGKHRSQKLDLRDGAAVPATLLIDGADVAIDPADTTLLATTVQDAVEELDDKAESTIGNLMVESGRIDDIELEVESRASSLEGRASALEGRATSLEGRATSLEGRATGLEGRVTALESPVGGSSLDVLQTLGAPETADATYFVYLPQTQADDAYRVRRHDVASMTFGANEISKVVVAYVEWTFDPKWTTGTSPRRLEPTERLVWAEVGSKELLFRSVGGTIDPASLATDVLGIAQPSGVVPASYLWMLVYEPTAAEKADGFTFDVLLSAWALKWLSGSESIDGFSVEIERAVILGR